MTINVLLVNGGKHEPITLLERDPGVNLAVVTEPQYREMYDPATKLILVPDLADFTSVRRAVLTNIGDISIERIVAATERSQPVAGYLRSYLGLPGMSFDIAHSFSHKYAMKQRLADAGLPVAMHRMIQNIDHLDALTGDIIWPIIIKPVLGSGSAHTFVFAEPADLAAFLTSEPAAKLRDSGMGLIAESYLTMTAEYHCDGVVIDGEVQFALPSKYFDPVLENMNRITGSVSLSPHEEDHSEILRLHHHAVRALALSDGVTHLELYKTHTGFVIGEIACRPGGAGIPRNVMNHSGVDLWREFIALSTGRPRAVKSEAPTGVAMYVKLPISPGRITHMTKTRQYLEIPGVIETDIRARIGDVLGNEIHSASFAGLLFLRVPDLVAAQESLEMIRAVHVLITEPSI